MTAIFWRIVGLLVSACILSAQVYSPKVLRENQPDPTDLVKFADAICKNAAARTPREKAEAIWRFFLTDGRFVKPGFWYHIAGWTYEEPSGEVLDPMKLLNSYGFGLCYHIAPLLEAVFKAAGFEDARCWFLTGHTVAEVFYQGAYHYFDSDMMGYNVPAAGSFRQAPVVSVHSLEKDSNLILGKLAAPNRVKPGVVDNPWYPADVQASAMRGLSELFTTTSDNYLYPYTRYSPGHRMDFVLRPGEKLIRFFQPETPGLFYLPYKFDGTRWTEFPAEIPAYRIRTADGPRSQKDNRLWATGRIEYAPRNLPSRGTLIVDMPSPYVVIDAHFKMRLNLPSSGSSLQAETSVDGGSTWQVAGKRAGPFSGTWSTEPAVIVRSAHGRLTAVSGSYGYKVRIAVTGPASEVRDLNLVSRIQLNPRSLPALQAGANQFVYSSQAPSLRDRVSPGVALASRTDLAEVQEHGESFWLPAAHKTGTALYKLESDSGPLSGFDIGLRFLDLRNGLAPEKLTAETRPVHVNAVAGSASISWSTSERGPFRKLWHLPEKLAWRDGDPIDRLLIWPEVLRQVRDLPPDCRRLYVRVQTSGPAFDSLRLATYAPAPSPSGRLTVKQTWFEGNTHREHVQQIAATARQQSFTVKAGQQVRNESIVIAND